MKPLFITGIGTDIGKTVVAAILTEKLKADYWKPIQSGDLDHSDTHKVKHLISNSKTQFHPEAYRLTQPFSPHKSADLDGIRIDMQRITAPATENKLIIEGAGGLMVPLNEQDLVVDLIRHLGAEVILVSRNYLGSINHTLLSLEVLRNRNIPLKGIIFNGESDPYSEDLILSFAGLKALARIPVINNLNKSTVLEVGDSLNDLNL